MTPAEIATLEHDGRVTLASGEQRWALTPEDVEILREDIQGWLVEADGGLTVALDTTLDDTLLAEGFARELVNRIQNMRKDAGFEVTDRMRITYDAQSQLAGRLEAQKTYIMNETLAEQCTPGGPGGDYSATLEVNGETLVVSIARVKRG